LPVIEVRVGGEIGVEKEAIARVERWQIRRVEVPKVSAVTDKISRIVKRV